MDKYLKTLKYFIAGQPCSFNLKENIFPLKHTDTLNSNKCLGSTSYSKLILLRRLGHVCFVFLVYLLSVLTHVWVYSIEVRRRDMKPLCCNCIYLFVYTGVKSMGINWYICNGVIDKYRKMTLWDTFLGNKSKYLLLCQYPLQYKDSLSDTLFLRSR